MKSSWDQSKSNSTYHFDPQRVDSESSVLRRLGQLPTDPEWHSATQQVISTAQPATWATRGYKGQGRDIPPADLAAEEYDLTRHGMPADLAISHLSWDIPQRFQSTVDSFGLKDCMARLHVQQPGEMWNLHIDKLSKWAPEDPDSVIRIFVQLTDWQPGQFYQFGNYNWHQWSAGDVVTFDWQNIPHCTANAGHSARVTLQLTGVKTPATQQFLDLLHQQGSAKYSYVDPYLSTR